MKLKVEADYNTSIERGGRYREVDYSIQQGRFKDERPSLYDVLPCSWTTYIYLTPAQHEELKGRINDAPWNGGQTYYRKFTEEHVDASPEMKAKWDGSYFKIGDDFQHLWDNERYELYDWEFMERHIKGVIDYLLDGPTPEPEGR